jgi:hypothetical protein
MWNPFRAREKSSGVTLDEVKKILSAYGNLLCDEEGALIQDESCLPTTKDRIKAALTVAIATAPTKEEREAHRCAYLFLANFQPGVGPHGIMKRVPELDIEDVRQKSPAYKEFVQASSWLEKTQTEWEA